MTLNPATAATDIYSALKTAGLANDSVDAEQVWNIICSQLFTHIKENMVVNSTGTGNLSAPVISTSTAIT